MQFLLLLVLQSRIKKLKMLKVAILDDYQNIAQEFIDLKNLSSKLTQEKKQHKIKLNKKKIVI